MVKKFDKTTQPYKKKGEPARGNSLFESALMQLGIDFELGRMVLKSALGKMDVTPQNVTTDAIEAALPGIEKRLDMLGAPPETVRGTMARLRLFLKRLR